MSGRTDNQITAKFTRAAFFGVALVLMLFLLFPIFQVCWRSATASAPAAPPENSPLTDPDESGRKIVLFWSGADASGTDPDVFGRILTDLDAFCDQRGWRLIAYDCKGNATSQKGQIEDFIRTESADIAILCSVMEQNLQDEKVKDLREKCKIITIGQKSGTVAGRYVAAHIGIDETERIRAAARYFKENLKRNKGILLLTDTPDAAAERQAERVFSEEKVTILGKNYTWTEEIYAERYLNTALDSVENVGGILCASAAGANGAVKVLRDKGLRDSVRVVSLAGGPALEDALALGDLDAIITPDPSQIQEILIETVTKLLKNEEVEDVSIPFQTLTAEK